MENRIGYLILLGCVGILLWSLIMGTEKMIKLILGNYLIAGTCFAFGECLTLRATQLGTMPEQTLLGMSYERFAHFLQNGQLTFIILLFILGVALVYTSSTITVETLMHPKTERIYYILLIPLTVLSFIFSLSFALMGGEAFMGIVKEQVSATFAFVANFVQYMPFRMLAHGIIILLITSQITWKFSATKKTTILPDDLGED